jgi:hypothetical protein
VTRYERLVRFIAERARQDKDADGWIARVSNGSEGRAISFVTTAEGFAELAKREPPDAMIRRLFGEGDGNALLEALGEGVQSSTYTVARLREDLSTQSMPEAGNAPELALVTRLRAASGGAQGCEEMIRKYIEAAAKVDEHRRVLVFQTAIGDLATYAVAQGVEDAAQLDSQQSLPELFAAASGASEAEKIFREGTSCIARAESELSMLRPDLSNPR